MVVKQKQTKTLIFQYENMEEEMVYAPWVVMEG